MPKSVRKKGEVIPMAEKKPNPIIEFLKQVELCDRNITNKLEELSHLKSMILKVTATWKQDVTSGGTDSQDKLGEAVAKIVDLENEINREIDSFIDKTREVSAVIQQVKDPDQLAVLHKRYFLYHTWEQIACDMNMSYRNVCYIHGKALQAVEELMK